MTGKIFLQHVQVSDSKISTSKFIENIYSMRALKHVNVPMFFCLNCFFFNNKLLKTTFGTFFEGIFKALSLLQDFQ